MTLLQFILINCNLILLYGLFALLAKRKGHLNFNRVFLLAIPPLAVLIPFIPSIIEPTNAAWAVELSEISIVGTAEVTAGSSSFPWVEFIYLTGLSISFIVFVLKLRKVIIHPSSRRVSKYRGANVYILDTTRSSYSFFNRIYINESQLEAAEVILFHESAHSKGMHSLDALIVSMYKVILWFNPISILIERSVKENHEFIADEHVLNQDITPEEYGNAMLMATFNCAIPSLGNGFNSKSLLRKRIEHLKLKNQFNMKHVLIVPVLTGLLLTTASLTIEPVEPNTITEATMVVTDEFTHPEFKGGVTAMAEYLSNEIKYPKVQMERKAEGKSFVEFDVDKDGSVINVKLMRSSGFDELDVEAVRAVSTMPMWNPGTKNGKAVKTQMKLPIVFKLPPEPIK